MQTVAAFDTSFADGGPTPPYMLHYGSAGLRPAAASSVGELFGKYGAVLWEPGRHKDNVTSFIGEINEILLGRRFSVFDQATIDSLLGSLRERGNSNATINRKMAALSKLLRKAYRMADIPGLPEFHRQKERAGRLRFLEWDEEDRLFRAIEKRCPDCYRLAVSLSTPAAVSGRRSDWPGAMSRMAGRRSG
jgi:hypothetical protein